MISINVIALDDEEPILHCLQEIFQGFNIKVFSKPGPFKESFEDNNTDLVITDKKVPGYNWVDTLTDFRKRSEGCYFIVLTGYISEDMIRPLLKLQVWDCVEKTSMNQWITDLKESLERLKPKLLRRAELLK